MKNLFRNTVLAVLFALFVCPTYANSVYQNKGTFSESLEATRLAYKDWVKKENSKLADKVKFSDWKGSFAFNRHKDIFKKISPLEKKPDFNAVYGGEKIWRDLPIIDCTSVDVMMYLNPYVNVGVTSYIYREIESFEDMKLPVTISSNGRAEIFLNGQKLGTLKSENDWQTSRPTVFNLDLKKGKNIFIMTMYTVGEKRAMRLYFAPFEDKAVAAAESFMKDYPDETRKTMAWAEKADLSIANMIAPMMELTANYQVMPSLIAAKDNSELMKMTLHNAIESAFFSAGELEKRVNLIENEVSEKGEVARAKLIEDIVASIKVESVLGYDIKNVRLAMEDMKKTYPDYPSKYFDTLKEYESKIADIKSGILKNDATSLEQAKAFKKFASEALLANPLLKQYPRWVYIKRSPTIIDKGLPQNWQGNTSITRSVKLRAEKLLKEKKIPLEESWKKFGYNDELWEMNLTDSSTAKFLFKPERASAISDLDISYDGKKIMYSTVDEKFRWNVDEFDVEKKLIKPVTPRIYDDIDNYSAVYLPDGKILYLSTACHVGVPCVGGSDFVANFYTLDPNAGDEVAVDKTIRQLTYEQDADWMPVVMENGRILYTRWEYVDNSHYFSRILMHMNPDGTAQSSFYGSTSYWPNSLFYCRPIPNDPNKFVGIVSGHHGVSRSGELHLFDVSKGTIEESGRLHKYPSYNREYVAETKDQLVAGKYPQILHPYPLSEKYIVVSARTAFSPFGIYLIDAFDNMTLIKEDANFSLFEPRPLSARPKPQEIADKTNRELDYGYVFLNDIYKGDGLKGVPRGTVKELRVFEYHYSYRLMGGHDKVSYEGSWDIKRIFGTVPVYEDGSAFFKVPANRPVAIQPLDKDGKALALMRSWFTVMPGEVQSCVGCHEGQGMSPSRAPAIATRKKPSEIKEFIAPVRGYSFERDIQPILDQYCVGCHDGRNQKLPNFSRNQEKWNQFPGAYMQLRKFIRTSGPECNQNLLTPMEFNADTSELICLLQKGHKNVKLDDTSMRALIAWVDMNVPCLGTWKEVGKIPNNGDKLRAKFLAKYANRHEDQEAITYDGGKREFQMPQQLLTGRKNPQSDKFPFSAQEASKMRDSLGLPKEIVVDMGNGVSMRFTLVPAGEFVMGNNYSFADEAPAKIVKIEKPFYMGQMEVSNSQYAVFDKSHNSGYFDRHYKDHINRGYLANTPQQPVVRVSWKEASAFADWFAKKFGVDAKLPTEQQWEWAARAGSGKDFWFGDKSANYGAYENLSDWQTKKFAVRNIDPQPILNPSENEAFVPRDDNVDDGYLVSSPVGSYLPNPFGLYDMFGNVAEWTSSDYKHSDMPKKVAKGGSWRDRAKWARASMRRAYFDWQKVYNVGFRIVIDDVKKASEIFKKAESLPLPPTRDTNPPVDTIK